MIKAAVLTILIETILFFLYGYRQKMFLFIVALANLLTNVSLNLAVFWTVLLSARQILPGFVLYIVIAAGEIAAIAVEYTVYETYSQKRENTGDAVDAGEIVVNRRSTRQKRRLFLQVLLSNAVSFGIGLLLTLLAG